MKVLLTDDGLTSELNLVSGLSDKCEFIEVRYFVDGSTGGYVQSLVYRKLDTMIDGCPVFDWTHSGPADSIGIGMAINKAAYEVSRSR